MSTYINIPPTQAGGGGALGFYSARAMLLAGLPADGSTGFFFDDFEKENAGTSLLGWAPFGSGTAAQTPIVAGSACGVVRLSTGATAGSIASNSQLGGMISNVSTARWYAASRFRVTTVPDNQTFAIAGLINQANTKTIQPGVMGTLNAAQYVVQYDGNFAGSSLALGVAFDTNFHVFEMYGQGNTTLRARIDGGPEVAAVMAAAAADFHFPNHQVRNGTTAANQILEMDWQLVVAARI